MPRKKSGLFDQNKYIQQFVREKEVTKKVVFNKETDSDLLAWLDSKRFSTYVKELIRNDMNKEGNQMMMYKVKEEFADLWGDYVVDAMTADDVETIAHGWEKSVEDVIDQLEPVNYESAVALMDDDLREEIHADIEPCSDARFLWEYCKRHEAKYGEPFAI